MTEPVFIDQVAFLEQLREPPLETRGILRVDPLWHKIAVFQVLGGFIAKQITDVLTDEGGIVLARRLKAVQHRGRGGEDMIDAFL